MKKLLALLLVAFLAINFVACSDDDDDGPTGPSTYKVSGTITDADGNGVSNQTVEAKSVDETKTTTTDSQGNYEFASLTAGATYTITADGANYYFKTDGAGEVTLNEDVTVNFTAVGIYGTWISEGDNVAGILYDSPYLNVRKLTATFRSDGTYSVEQVDSAGAVTNLTGIFTMTKSTVDNIFSIQVVQDTPSLTSEGIFEIYADSSPYTMKYEIILTVPDYGYVPATPEAGFGSSNAGSGPLGDYNIQVYVRQ